MPLQGGATKAHVDYQDSLALWKGGDPDIPVLRAAKAECSHLLEGRFERTFSRHLGSGRRFGGRNSTPKPKLSCRYRLSSTWPSRQLDYQPQVA